MESVDTTFDFVRYEVANRLRDRVFGDRYADIPKLLECQIKNNVSHELQSKVYHNFTAANPMSWTNTCRQIKVYLFYKEL